MPTRVLFVCSGNGTRAMMASRFLEHLGRDEVEVAYAALESGPICPAAAEAMAEIGLPLPGWHPPSLFELHRHPARYDLLVTLCLDRRLRHCDEFVESVRRGHLRRTRHLRWDVPTLDELNGDAWAGIDRAREVRNQIHDHVADLVAELRAVAVSGNPVRPNSSGRGERI